MSDFYQNFWGNFYGDNESFWLNDSGENFWGGSLPYYPWAAEFDAHRINTLYQGVSQSTPVTANAQNVGRWENNGSGGAQLLQATANARPTYYSALFNSAYPGVKFVTDDWMSCDFGASIFGTAKIWLVAVAAIPNHVSGTTQFFGFDADPLSDATPDRWGNADALHPASSNRLDFYMQGGSVIQFPNRPQTPVCWSVTVAPTGTPNIRVKLLQTSGGSITTGTQTQSTTKDLRLFMLGARSAGSGAVDRIVNELDVNYFAFTEYGNYPGSVAEELYMRELLARIGL